MKKMSSVSYLKSTIRRSSLKHCLGSIIAIGIVGISSSAGAQAPPGFDETLQKKYSIMQQQADAQTKNAETERMQAERSRALSQRALNRTSSQSANSITEGDALEGVNVATYLLGNGSILKTTGVFRPTPPGTCVANCPKD